MDRKQFLIERMRLKNIKEEINNLEGVSVINIYERADIYPKYKDALDNIYKIEFPVLTTKEIGDENYKYVEYLYKYLKLQTDSYRWLFILPFVPLFAHILRDLLSRHNLSVFLLPAYSRLFLFLL